MAKKETEKEEGTSSLIERVSQATSFEVLDGLKLEVATRTNRLDAMSRSLRAVFFVRVKELFNSYNDGKTKKNQMPLAEIGDRYNVSRSFLSKLFAASDDPKYLTKVSEGKVDLQGREISDKVSVTGKKRIIVRPVVERAKETVDKLAKMFDKSTIQERIQLIEYAKEKLPFGRDVKEPEKVTEIPTEKQSFQPVVNLKPLKGLSEKIQVKPSAIMI